jgi:hypothetical protein
MPTKKKKSKRDDTSLFDALKSLGYELTGADEDCVVFTLKGANVLKKRGG